MKLTVLLLVLLHLTVPDGTLLLYQTYFMMAFFKPYTCNSLIHCETALCLSYMPAVSCPIVAIFDDARHQLLMTCNHSIELFPLSVPFKRASVTHGDR
jgi:hypothetical protein